MNKAGNKLLKSSPKIGTPRKIALKVMNRLGLVSARAIAGRAVRPFSAATPVSDEVAAGLACESRVLSPCDRRTTG